MIVLATLGAPPRRLLERRRRPKRTESAEPEPVPTTRATVIRAAPFASEQEAAEWLDGLRSDGEALAGEAAAAARELNGLMRAHRAAAGDPYAADVSPSRAIGARVGYGSGDQVAHGRFAAALELPRTSPTGGRSERLLPQERLAALLGARTALLACEELVLRARADVNAGRPREAALQARIALEALATELAGTRAGAALGELEARRDAIADAANAALREDPPPELQTAVAEAVAEMERALRRHRLAGMEAGGADG